MHLSQRLSLWTLLVCVVAGAACGGPDLPDHAGSLDPASTDLKGGAVKTTTVKMVATPALADRNGPLTISVYPGAYADQMLFVKWQCYQNGQMMAQDGSYELNNAANTGRAGYVRYADHLDWTFVVSESVNDNLVAGSANCQMQAWYENRRLQWFQIGSGTFDLLP